MRVLPGHPHQTVVIYRMAEDDEFHGWSILVVHFSLN